MFGQNTSASKIWGVLRLLFLLKCLLKITNVKLSRQLHSVVDSWVLEKLFLIKLSSSLIILKVLFWLMVLLSSALYGCWNPVFARGGKRTSCIPIFKILKILLYSAFLSRFCLSPFESSSSVLDTAPHEFLAHSRSLGYIYWIKTYSLLNLYFEPRQYLCTRGLKW